MLVTRGKRPVTSRVVAGASQCCRPHLFGAGGFFCFACVFLKELEEKPTEPESTDQEELAKDGFLKKLLKIVSKNRKIIVLIYRGFFETRDPSRKEREQ